MLCGGSDAVIIPIGANSFSYITLFPLFLKFKLREILSLCTNAGLGGFVACRALSQRNNDPTKASRPWDTVSFNNFLSCLLFLLVLACFKRKYTLKSLNGFVLILVDARNTV